MFKLGDITVSRKLILLLALAFVGFVSLLLISANALQRNLMSEREARLNAVLEQAMSQIQFLASTLPGLLVLLAQRRVNSPAPAAIQADP